MYSYPRNTTPLLGRYPLTIYKDVLSPAGATGLSHPLMLTFKNLNTQDEHITRVYDVFKNAGFETYSFGMPYNHTSSLYTVHSAAEHQRITTGDDKQRFENIISLLKENQNSKNFILLCTDTAHLPYDVRYPQDTPVFADTPPHIFPNADKNIVNHYDTAILYLDTLLYNFLEDLKNLENTVVLITADHGQEVGDYSTSFGATNASIFPSNYEIPFFLYISEDYKESLSSLVFDTSRPYQNDNLIHSLLEISHIKSPLFVPEYSIFNKDYQEQKRTIRDQEYRELKEQMEEKRSQAFN